MIGGNLAIHYVLFNNMTTTAGEGGSVTLGNNFGTLNPTFTMTAVR